MKEQRNFTIPFAVAVLLNVAGIVGAAHLLIMYAEVGGMVPGFQMGKSGLEMTLLSSQPTPEEKAESPKEQIVMPMVDPAPADDDDPVVVETDIEKLVDPSDRSSPDRANASRLDEGPDRPGEDSNADALPKGVEGGAYPVSEIRVKYPPVSRQRGEQGSVTVKALVDDAGNVRDVQVVKSSGHSALDKAAVKGVREAKYFPEFRDGRGHACEVVKTVSFVLTDRHGRAEREDNHD